MKRYLLAHADVPVPLERREKAQALIEWLLGEGRMIKDANLTLEGAAERLRAAGVPLDRATTVISVLHAEWAGVARIWERGARARDIAFAYGEAARAGYAASPFKFVHDSGEWLSLDIPGTPDDAFNVVPELKALGLVGYICAPVTFINGMQNGFTFATKEPDGFSAEDVAVLRMIFPTLGALMEILAVHRILREVLRIYVGQEPHLRILEGEVHRGEVTRINSAILFADMRGFTSLSMGRDAAEVTEILNRYYDCVVPHVEKAGGEVLKFIGDGVLAIFRSDHEVSRACARAMAATRAALAAVDAHNAEGGEKLAFDIGVGLHLGEAAYGNVGSGNRLDFTVIGRDVNIASRIADLCGTLTRRILMSETFATAFHDCEFEDLGLHALKGVDAEQRVIAADG